MTWTWLGIVAVIFIVFWSIIGFQRGFIREVVATAFVALSLVIVAMINPYVNQFLKENTPLERIVEEKCTEYVSGKAENIQTMGREGQNALLENLGLPKVLTQNLQQDNTGETYQYLAVQNFVQYVAQYLTNTFVNGISFLVSYLLVRIALRILLAVLDLLSKLPIIHGINRLAGAVIGAGKGVIFVWIALLVLTIACNTEWGSAGMKLVEQDSFLSVLYEKDILIQFFMSVFYGK